MLERSSKSDALIEEEWMQSQTIKKDNHAFWVKRENMGLEPTKRVSNRVSKETTIYKIARV